MYLREPWVVGKAGVLGAIGIITLATLITGFTVLSMSSIVTNTRIKAVEDMPRADSIGYF